MTEENNCLRKECNLPKLKHSVWCKFHTNKTINVNSSFTHIDRRTGVERQIPLVKKLTRNVKQP